MSKIKNLIIKYKEIILYIIFGAATTVVNFVVFKLFNIVMGEEWYLVSNIIAWFASVIFAFVTNKLLVFESKSWQPAVFVKEALSFFAARVFSFLVEEGGLYVLVDWLRFDRFSIKLLGFNIDGKLIAKVVLAVVVVIMNYFFSKILIFKKKKEDQ